MSETSLDFHRFYVELNEGQTPFPWQTSLAEHVVSTGKWPAAIDVPTGLGKTSLIDIAVFALAASAGAGHSGGRRRIFFVVDRRLVVDEAHDHALELVSALVTPPTDRPQLREVAERLTRLVGDTAGENRAPLIAVKMRGGVSWDSAWVDRPDQPVVVTGTIDQVGSRAFFRGYNTSNGRKPIDAALVARDSLIVIDEAHLASAFTQSLRSAFRSERDRFAAVALADTVELSATHSGPAEPMAFDVHANLAHPIAAQRLNASKQMLLAEVSDRKKLTDAIVGLTVRALADRPGARALVVCNTVDRARGVHAELAKALRTAGLALPSGEAGPGEPELMIGRSRPFDRDGRALGIRQRFGVERSDREHHDTIDVLVATQTVEVGANLDFDVLVTESAPLDAVTQRLGRLNRLGRSDHAPALAVVVHDGQRDFVYGDSRLQAWEHLVAKADGVIDLDAGTENVDAATGLSVSPLALRQLLAAAPLETYAPLPQVPAMNRTTLAAFARTAPMAEPDPDLAQYLHGRDSSVPGVSICWRDNMTAAVGGSAIAILMEEKPARAGELVEVPITAVKAWLSGGKVAPVADIDTPESELPMTGLAGPTVGAYQRGEWRAVFWRAIRPGDTIVVPSTAGGLDNFGWNPGTEEPVTDVWELVTSQATAPVLRVDALTAGRILVEPMAGLALANGISKLQLTARDIAHGRDVDPDRLEELKRAVVAALAATLASGQVHPAYEPLLTELLDSDPEFALSKIDGEWSLRPRARDRSATTIGQLAEDQSETGSSVSRSDVTLDAHHADVAARTQSIANALGIDPALTEVLRFAAGNHDLGKLDVRFQAALRDGDRWTAEFAAHRLAKSGIDPSSREARDARQRSKLPRGFRHEAWSAGLAAQLLPPEISDGWRRDLTLHLIASHHGHSRPFLPAVIDAAPETIEYGAARVVTDVTVDFDGPARLARLTDQFGHWGLALLETVVRAADQTCSREGK